MYNIYIYSSNHNFILLWMFEGIVLNQGDNDHVINKQGIAGNLCTHKSVLRTLNVDTGPMKFWRKMS